MLMLPSGQVLFTTSSSQLYVYTPNGSPQTAWKPTITSVVANGNHYTLTGTQLNGISAGASYGDDAEMDTNYPIVKLTSSSGKVYYARTFNWSSTGVATGSAPVTTDFSLPANMPYGTYSLSVIANGIASSTVSFTGGIVGSSADLIVTNSGPSNGTEGGNLTFNLTVTNNGPTSTSNVVLTDTLDPNFRYVSSTKSTGTVTQSGNVVTFSFGSLAVGQTVTASVTAQAGEVGNYTDTATATSSLTDANVYNNTASVTVPVADPPIVVSAPLTTTSRTLTNQTVATFTHANGFEPASCIFGHDQLGRCHNLDRYHYEIGQHVFCRCVAYLCGERHLYNRYDGCGTDNAAAASHLDAARESCPGGGVARISLLSDGSVIIPRAASGAGTDRLIPDSSGSYINGTWTKAAGFGLVPRSYDSQIVLPDGRLLVIGGIQNNTIPLNDGQIYDPTANAWTNIASFPATSTLGTAPIMLLADGRIIAGSMTDANTYFYDPSTDAWTQGPSKCLAISVCTKLGRNCPMAAFFLTTSTELLVRPNAWTFRIRIRHNGNGSMPVPYRYR